jgi:hypothetical protein
MNATRTSTKPTISAARTGLQAEIDRLKFEIERLKTVQTELDQKNTSSANYSQV